MIRPIYAWIALRVLLAMLTLSPIIAGAQVDPRGPLRTITTSHFRVHFRAADSTLARRAGALAERAYIKLSTELVAPKGKIDLALADNTDASNGFAQVFPNNRVVIYAVPPVAIQELRFQSDWLELVITHELAHIFHIDRARGIWSVGRSVFGRNPLFFPNQLLPSWVKEGLAVYYESKLTGSGRNVSTEAPLVLRAAALDGAFVPISRWSTATTRFPLGQTAYAYGAQLMLRAADAANAADSASAAANTANAKNTKIDYGMRRFVERTAIYPIPFLLNARSREGFGTSFTTLFDRLRDSLSAATASFGRSGDSEWTTISSDGWYAEAPRWRGADTLVWTARNGREPPGLYEAFVGVTHGDRVGQNASNRSADTRPAISRITHATHRVARRNSTDVNVPIGGDSVLFAQVDYTDPYTLRSDLYTGLGSSEKRLTYGDRLTQPDIRADGEIVAVQLGAASARLVRVSRRGAAIAVTPITSANLYAEPTWSPDGRFIAAAELLPGGDQRITVMDTLGRIVKIVAGGRAVFASPTFTPSGDRLVWTSDRTGRTQLETASIDLAPLSSVAPDTLDWRTERAAVTVASDVTTGVFQPRISPDGKRVAALLYRADGFHVAVAAVDTAGTMARGGWYTRDDTARADSAGAITAPVRKYSLAVQLRPRYWLPAIGTGRDGESTYGFSSSAGDIMERHDWFATALINPRFNEVDAGASYRYRGLGVPVLDLSARQEWDATFRATDTSNTTLGFIARRRRFATVATTFSRPRVRLSMNGTLGAQYEWRDFTSEVDSLLGNQSSLLRRGTRYPSLFVNADIANVRRAGRAIAFEEGFILSTSTSYRWREDAPSLGSWRGLATLRGYVPLDLPGFARHVLFARVTGGFADTKTATEFSVGGVSGLSTAVVPGVQLGDPSRAFPVRGVEVDAQRGTRAVGGSVEYRLPLFQLRSAPGPFTLFADRLSMTVFSDAARAWCPSSLAGTVTTVCEPPGTRDGIIASAGAEVVLDLAVQYDISYRLRLGGAAPYAAPREIARRPRFFITLGSYF